MSDEVETVAIRARNGSQPFAPLARDLRMAGMTLNEREARFLVDTYQLFQRGRIRSGQQLRKLIENDEPNSIVSWLHAQELDLEQCLKVALDSYSMSRPEGRWARGICGVGPVIAAGLMAHIDVRKAPTAGHIWRYAGLDPTRKWEKGEKRPWNAQLKTLCIYILGESFVKVQHRPNDVYGRVYAERKRLEIERNEAGVHAEEAARNLRERKLRRNTAAYGAYRAGKLPLARIHLRAKRYAVKLFLAHYHEVVYRITFGKAPPLPYPVVHLGHAHIIPPPFLPFEVAAE